MQGLSYYYVPGRLWAQDVVRFDEYGNTIPYQGSELSVVIVSEEVFYSELSRLISTFPSEISSQRFIEMLTMLPPLRHRCYPDSESFMFSEQVCIGVTDIFVRIHDRYFSFKGATSLTHAQIVMKVEKHISGNSARA